MGADTRSRPCFAGASLLAGAQCYEVADEEQNHVTLEARTVARPLSSFETLWEWFSGAWTKMGPTSVRDLTTFRLRRWQEIPQAVVDAVVRGRQMPAAERGVDRGQPARRDGVAGIISVMRARSGAKSLCLKGS